MRVQILPASPVADSLPADVSAAHHLTKNDNGRTLLGKGLRYAGVAQLVEHTISIVVTLTILFVIESGLVNRF